MTLSRRNMLGSGASLLAFPMIAKSRIALAAGGPAFSKRAIDVVKESLVIDMLAPLKISLTADAYTRRLTDAEKAEFRGSGITGFHSA